MLDSSNKTRKPKTGPGPSCWWLALRDLLHLFPPQRPLHKHQKENLRCAWLQCPMELFPKLSSSRCCPHRLCTHLMPPPASRLQGQAREPLCACVRRMKHGAWKAAGGRQANGGVKNKPRKPTRAASLHHMPTSQVQCFSFETHSTFISRHVGHTSEPWV